MVIIPIICGLQGAIIKGCNMLQNILNQNKKLCGKILHAKIYKGSKKITSKLIGEITYTFNSSGQIIILNQKTF
jgi:hypothetical protein